MDVKNLNGLSEDTWPLIRNVIRTIEQRNPETAALIQAKADQIYHLYHCIDGDLDDICRLTCPTCEDVCCMRARLWFDVKDLIPYYTRFGRFPDGQIVKTGKGTASACCYLSLNGCKLPRAQRPYVCTWYLCPDQKTILKTMPVASEKIEASLARIKLLRNQIRNLFLGFVADGSISKPLDM